MTVGLQPCNAWCMKNTAWLLFVAVVFCPGCGGGAEGTGGIAVGVDPETSISKLDDTAARAQCAAYTVTIADVLSDQKLCRQLSVFAAPLYLPVEAPYLDPTTPEEATAECERARPYCEALYAGDDSFAKVCKNPGPCILENRAFRERCEVPVGILSACIDEEIANLELQYESYTCDRHWEVVQGEIVAPPWETPSCDFLSMRCGPVIVDLTECSANLLEVEAVEFLNRNRNK